jgi:hypothetical protein
VRTFAPRVSAPVVEADSGGPGTSLLQRDGEPSLRLDPEFRQPPPMFAPGSIRETYVIPMPADIQLVEPPHVTEPRRLRFLEEGLQPPQTYAPVQLIPVSRCVPNVALTWADFQGTPPAGGHFGAFTRVRIAEENVQGNVMFRAVMNNADSWVKPQYPGAGARATNGCARTVTRCQQFFDSVPAGQTGTWDYGPSPDCPAGAQTPTQATSRGECETAVGTQCDTDTPAESARLLAHEQGHFDIACVLVGKADDALAAGSALDLVRRRLNAKVTQQNAAYDTQTNHGCNAGPQATWTANLAAGLPAVTIP